MLCRFLRSLLAVGFSRSKMLPSRPRIPASVLLLRLITQPWQCVPPCCLRVKCRIIQFFRILCVQRGCRVNDERNAGRLSLCEFVSTLLILKL